MRLSTVLFLCIFLFACTGVLDNACRRLAVRPGRAAAFALLLAALSGVMLPLFGRAAWNPASLLLAAAAVPLAGRARETFAGLGLALLSGVLAWLLLRFLPGGTGRALPMAAIPLLVALCFPRRPRTLLLAVLLAPLFAELAWDIEEWALFGYLEPVLGGGDALDAEALCLVGLCAGLSLPVRRKKRSGNPRTRVVSCSQEHRNAREEPL